MWGAEPGGEPVAKPGFAHNGDYHASRQLEMPAISGSDGCLVQVDHNPPKIPDNSRLPGSIWNGGFIRITVDYSLQSAQYPDIGCRRAKTAFPTC